MSLHVQKMKPSRRIPAWQCIQKIACLKAIITISHLCHGFGFTVAPSLQRLPPPALQIIGEDRTSIFSFKDDSVPIISSSSSFQSIALSWLDQEEALPTQSASSTIFLSSLLVATEESSTTTPADASDSAASSSWSNQILNAKSSKTDKVKRIIDASTIQLEKGGYVSLESVRGAGSTYRLPDCMTFGPSYKLRKLLPKGTAVRYVVGLDENNNAKSSSAASSSSSSSTTPRVWIIRDKDQLLINQELVKSGFAFVRKGTKAPPGMMDDLMKLERSAKQQGLGIYKSCNAEEESGEGSGLSSSSSSSSSDITATFVAEFEPLDFTTEIHYGDDGGKSVVVPRKESSSSSTPPSNPGDIKGCSDFRTYEESLRWYETYFPYYGDVARLDRDGDGVPCPGLPHTTVGEKYRMKAPNAYAKKAS